jgi:hypothetical protein
MNGQNDYASKLLRLLTFVLHAVAEYCFGSWLVGSHALDTQVSQYCLL